MARIRSIKPEFWTDEKVVELSAFARLLFIGLWNFADDYGRMVYSPKRIKMQVFPADAVDIDALFAELLRERLVITYVAEAQEFLTIPGFERHQKVDKRAASRIPPPPGDNHQPPPVSPESPRIPPTPPEARPIPAPDQGMEGIKEMEEKRGAIAPVAFDDASRALIAFNEVASRAGLPQAQVLNDTRRKAITARLRECGGLGGWASALVKLEASDWCCGRAARSDGWKADLDFLTQRKSFTRLMEGFYDNRTPGKTQGRPAGRFDTDRLLAGGAAFVAGVMGAGPKPAGYG